MSIFSSPWSLRRVALLGGILALAAVAGVASELLAQEFAAFSGEFRGGTLVANWVDFAADGDSSAQTWAATGVTRRGRPQDVSMAWLRGTHWSDQGVMQVSAVGEVPPDGILVPRGLGFGRLKAELPGSISTWSRADSPHLDGLGGPRPADHTWSRREPATVEVIINLIGEGKPSYEDSLRRTYDPASGNLTNWHTRGTMVDATGTGGIRVNGEDWVPESTALTWGELRNTRLGSVHENKVKLR